MNVSQQAQKGFKTFILTLSISLLLFSAIYYLINSNSGSRDVAEVSGVETASEDPKEEESNLYSYDESEYADEEAAEEEVVSPVVEEDFSDDTDSVIVDAVETEEENEEPVESAFGSLVGQDLDVEGQKEPVKDSIAMAEEKDPSVIDEETVEEDAVLGASDAEDTEETTVGADNEEDTDKEIEETAVEDEEEPSAFGDLALETEETEETPNLVASNETNNIGGVNDATNPQVLAGADETTQSSPVPDTGVMSLTFGLIVSLLVFAAAMVWIYNDPRRLAMEGFEKRATKDPND